jgi:hypothetical protein
MPQGVNAYIRGYVEMAKGGEASQWSWKTKSLAIRHCSGKKLRKRAAKPTMDVDPAPAAVVSALLLPNKYSPLQKLCGVSDFKMPIMAG